MALGELLISRCFPEKHEWHLRGHFIEEDKVIGELDIELGRGSYKLSDITIMAEKRGIDSWRLSCDRCGFTQIYGTFLPKRG